jgi:hypothetical protein
MKEKFPVIYAILAIFGEIAQSFYLSHHLHSKAKGNCTDVLMNLVTEKLKNEWNSS